MKKDARKVYIRTFGCQMNVRDAEVIKGLLRTKGYRFIDSPREADVVLLNTCSVRQHAEDRVWSQIGSLRKRPGLVVGVLGCMAQNYKQDILKRAPYVDIVCGPSEIDNIALYLEKALCKKRALVAVRERRRREAIYSTGFREDKGHAYVVISEGCDNYCSYCVVPFVRGRLRHRSAAKILGEIKAAVASGASTVTLLGQNVNSYRSGSGRGSDFVALLKRVARVPGVLSASFISCHPKDTRVSLFRLMAQQSNIKKRLHMPFQAGSDRVLKRMGRGYTAARYLELAGRYRDLVPDGELSTDVIVGFPGETEACFAATRRLMERVRFDAAYIFKYSPRPHTRAAQLEDDVPVVLKKKRHAELLDLQKRISREKKEEGRKS